MDARQSKKNKHLQYVKFTRFHDAKRDLKIVLLRNIGRVVRNKGTLRFRFSNGREGMKRISVLAATLFAASAAFGQAEVTLTRIDCGTGAQPTKVNERFSDTFSMKDLALTFTFSCYLIKHGTDYMVWDTGFAPGSNPNAPKVSLADQLKQVNVTPEQVKFVG